MFRKAVARGSDLATRRRKHPDRRWTDPQIWMKIGTYSVASVDRWVGPAEDSTSVRPGTESVRQTGDSSSLNQVSAHSRCGGHHNGPCPPDVHLDTRNTVWSPLSFASPWSGRGLAADPGWIGEIESVLAREHAHVRRMIGVEAEAVSSCGQRDGGQCQCRRRHGGHLWRSGRAALAAVMQAAHFG